MEFLEDILVPIVVVGGLWVMIGAIAISGIVNGAKTKRELHETVRRAIDSGQPLTPEVLSALHKPPRTPEHDLRSGVILSALAIGFLLCAIVYSFSFADGAIAFTGGGTGFMIAALVIGAIGAGQLIAWRARRDRSE